MGKDNNENFTKKSSGNDNSNKPQSQNQSNAAESSQIINPSKVVFKAPENSESKNNIKHIIKRKRIPKHRYKLKKRVGLLVAFKFSWKNMFFDKSIIIVSLTTIFFSILFGITAGIFKNFDGIDKATEVFQYFFIIVFVIMFFLLIMRMCQYYFLIKIEDKTIYIIIAHQVSRLILACSFWLVMLVFLFLIIVLDCSFLLLGFLTTHFSVTQYFVKITLVYALYSFVYSFFLIGFFSFLFICLNKQVSLIIITFLLSLNFINNLPKIFLDQADIAQKIEFDDGTSLMVPEIYDAFTLQEKILKNQMRYNYLSKTLNSYFLSNKLDSNNFITSDTKKIRQKFYENTGLFSTKYKINTDIKDVSVGAVPDSWEDNPEWNMKQNKDGIKADLHLEINKSFATPTQLDDLIESTTDPDIYKFLDEFKSFMNWLLAEHPITDFENKNEANFKNIFYDRYVDYIYSKNIAVKPEENDLISFLTKTSSSPNPPPDPTPKSQNRDARIKYISEDDISSFYKNYFSDGKTNGLYLSGPKITNLINNTLYNPVLYTAVILDYYFIDYTTNYLKVTGKYNTGKNGNPMTKNINLENSKWNDYVKRRNLYNGSFYVNVFANSIGIFSMFIEKQYTNYWFNVDNVHTIKFDKNDNVFLPPSTFTLSMKSNGIIDENSFKNKTNIYIAIIIQLIFAAITYACAFIYLNRKNLQ